MNTKTQIILAISFSLIIAIALLAFWFTLLWLDETRKSIVNKSENTNIETTIFLGKQGGEGLFPVKRNIEVENNIEIETLKELLKGVNPEEESQYFSSINQGVEIQEFRIEGGVAYVDFTEKLDEAVAGSARVLMIREQIEKTLLQFESISQVVISINGKVDDILQP